MTAPTDDVGLLLCPFCGARPHKLLSKTQTGSDGEVFQSTIIQCPKRHARVDNRVADFAVSEWNQRVAPTPVADPVERVARAICDASGDTWRGGIYPAYSGTNFKVEDHALDSANNHWRHKARAALAVIAEGDALLRTELSTLASHLVEAQARAETAEAKLAEVRAEAFEEAASIAEENKLHWAKKVDPCLPDDPSRNLYRAKSSACFHVEADIRARAAYLSAQADGEKL